MKQTAVEKMIQYFIEQKNNGVSHWCINDLSKVCFCSKTQVNSGVLEIKQG